MLCEEDAVDRRNRQRLLQRLLQDECGAIAGADYILAVTILTVGAVTGLATVRDAVVQEFGDLAIGMETIDQSYTVNATFANGQTIQFGFDDPEPTGLEDEEGMPPHGIEICDQVSLGTESN
ncbi:MAG: hypothetical protein DWQ34_26760 [Planctomycetota bacterium]|nr:MAG: hypothetical protein DWQ34_26760 [Planctomycetota bacterium]REJ89733.1 MAG: hypothetical protein DWQ29_07380 [Planctomycetota bacterium]REK22820.1 MAG: hypothetical protein DWQ41_18665 [Planctomycetota bacterium]REK31585.1 MAG: hypothetical protein DWQ45_19375 [Planctomycetota bacterium]